MKNYHFILLAFIVNLNTIMGQGDFKVAFGLKIGMNYTMPKMVDLESMEFNNQFGPDLGAFTDFTFNRHIGLKMEVLYSVQNIHMESYGIGDGNGTRIGTVELNQKVRDQYLIFPVLFKTRLLKKLDFLIGPQLGLLISDENRFLVIDGIIFTQNEPIDNVSLSGNFELSFSATAKLNLGLRYNLGVGKINSLRNTGFQLYLGYALL
ncbi:outer membrane beta-barrel protein [Ulvibacterium marinum]|uniref:outer membrane beta-barrel protein n=1 Tax=Ulvibacterium marinum TaxID=2419782 RepID=UPI001313DCC0|nr:outer membrane beta-barrel protein [Ulvibacterium marinum]